MQTTKLKFLPVFLIFFCAKFFLFHFKHSIRDDGNGDSSTVTPNEISLSSDQFESSYHRHLLAMRVIRPHPSANCTPLAVENFPKDVFTQRDRQRGAIIIHIFGAVYMFLALAILCDEYFIPCLERICEVLNLQPDVAGATFMAAGSSAPELATTLVGVFIAKDDIGLGAVVGSADFNIMLVVSVTALFAKQVIYLNWWPLVRDCFFYLLSIIILALVIVDEHVYWYEALVLLLLYAAYVAFMYVNRKVDSFLNLWCHQHPNFCPRVLHTEAEKQQSIQQHSGAFANTNAACDDIESSAAQTKYERLGDIEKFGDGLTAINVNDVSDQPSKFVDKLPTAEEGQAALETQICEPEESWADTCFAPLRLPRSQGVRAKFLLFCALIVWPLRLAMCLTIPHVRKTKWRRNAFSHWISFVMCCVWIGLFTIIMMWMIAIIGVTLHIPDTIMGLTFIAAGSSVPDAIASILVVREGEGDMAVSNAVGSNVFDILVCMGLPWLLKCWISGAPVLIYSKGLIYAVLTLFTTVLFLLGVTHLNRWRLTKPYGLILLFGYFIVLVFCSCYELNLFGTVHLPECPLIE